MAATLKGQLGVKSSPLCPTSSKYTTQLLVLDHMTNHYRKLSKVKSAIDNAAPKSMQTSQKMRDRRRRKDIEKYGSRPASSMSYRPSSREEDIYDETQWEEPENDEERQVRDIMRTTLRAPLKATHPKDSVDATAGSRSESTYIGRPQSASFRGVTQAVRGAGYFSGSRPVSARSTTSLASNFSQTSRCSNPLKATYDGDILEKHAHVFKEPKKFTPRTLKSNRESSLKKYKYYTPPKKTQVTYEDQVNTEVKSESREVPQARPRRKNREKGVDLGATETLTETKLMEMSLRSHDPRHPTGDGNDVPRLDISMDKDHLNWLQDQASKAKIRAHNGSNSQKHDGGDTLEQTDNFNNTDTLRFTRTSSSAKSFGVKSPTSRRLGQAEEEQKYVEFAHEVTQDIVSRGICSDRVLNKVFENHIDRRKRELDEKRLRAIITDIRRDLGVDHVQLPQHRVRLDDDHNHMANSEDFTYMNGTADMNGTTNMNSTAGLMNGDTLGFDSTMMSQTNNTYNFDKTTDVFSTIHSNIGGEEYGELSSTQALKQYQMDLTVKDSASDRGSAADNGLDHTLTAVSGLDETTGTTVHNGERSVDSAGDGHTGVEEITPTPAARPRARRLARQNASTAGNHEVLSDAASAVNDTADAAVDAAVNDTVSDATGSPQHGKQDSRPASDTEERTEEDYEDEEYESDYDADDDRQDGGTHRTSDDDF